MKRALTLLFWLLISSAAFGQAATVNFAWDANTTDGTATNPVKYKVYSCTDAAMLTCTATDAGTAVMVGVNLNAGTYYWVYATCYVNKIDTEPLAGILESPKSNVLNFKLNVPPGNPKNFKIKLQ